MSFMLRIKQRIHQFGDFVLKNRRNPAILVLIFSSIPLMGWMSTLIVALITLRKGAIEGAWILLFAIIPHAAWGFATGHPEFIIIDVVLGLGFVWFASLVLRSTASWATTLEATAFFAVAVICLAHWYFVDIAAFWISKMQEYLHFLQSATDKMTAAQLTSVKNFALLLQDKPRVDLIASVLTGLFTGLLLFSNLFNVLVARWWQSSMFNPGGLSRELRGIRLSYIGLGLLFVVFGLAALKFTIAKDLVFIVVLLFFLAGLSVMHALLNTTKKPLVWLVISYIAIMLTLPASLLIIMVLAISDILFDFRKKMAKKLSGGV